MILFFITTIINSYYITSIENYRYDVINSRLKRAIDEELNNSKFGSINRQIKLIILTILYIYLNNNIIDIIYITYGIYTIIAGIYCIYKFNSFKRELNQLLTLK